MENLSNSGVTPQYIPLHLIEKFTNHFSNDRKIGDGTYGDVYKGILPNAEAIAVKMLRFMPEKDDKKQFKKEVENLMRLRHENIVRLIAYSYEVKHMYKEISESADIDPRRKETERKSIMVLAEEVHRALCFEYLQNGSLQKHLYDEYNGLDWPTRYKIIKGMCEALKYLHEGLETPLLHLDLKPDNILLDKNMVPKLADFGLSRLFTEEQTRSLQQIAEQKKSQTSGVGTIGYMPPEYIDKNEYSEKFDIFSLGVIIIKIMSGEQGYHECNPMISRDNDIERVLENWRSRLRTRVAYTTLEEECRQVKTCIETALDCLHLDPSKRPNIGSIVQRLNETENKIKKLTISLPYYNSRNFPGSDANKMPASKVLVQVKPQKLCYCYSNELNENMASSLHLKNMTDDYVAYMFMVSGWGELSSSRAKGIISPGSEWEVDLNMKAENTVLARRCEDKVILRSANVSKDLKPDNITLDMFKQTGTIVDEVKLDVVVEERDPLQFRIQEEFDKHQENADPFKMLDVQPIELCFPFDRNKMVPCSVYLTNITGKHVAFRLIEKTVESGCFVELPRQGILPPGSTHTLIVTTKKLAEQPQKRDYDLILQTCVLGHLNKLWPPFEDQYECDEFFTEVEESGALVHEVAMKASSQEKYSEIVCMENTRDILYCLDTNPIKKWIVSGYCSGYIRIGNYETQIPVNSFKVSNTAVCAVKSIARERCFVVGSFDGFLHVYDCGTKVPNKKKSWKACHGFITTLAVHPTEPYVLSSANHESIKLWNWNEGWNCTQTFVQHVSVRQLVFNPTNTNVFAGASSDGTVKVWKLNCRFAKYTLEGHCDKVTCLDYFSCGDHQYLISGSKDRTAKIWNMQKKMCIQTLDAFLSPLTCVSAHPNLPVLITGSEDGILHLWSSSNFRLERILNIASGGNVRGIGCLMGSRRVVIGQSSAISELNINSMNYHEASMPCIEQYQSGDEAQEETAAGKTTSEESHVISSCKKLEIHPLQLNFPVDLNKPTTCLAHLKNCTNEPLEFNLDTNYGDWNHFLCLPVRGVVPPWSTYYLTVTSKKLNRPPKRRDINMYLRSWLFPRGHGRHQDTLKAVYGSQGELNSEVAPLSVKVLPMDNIPRNQFPDRKNFPWRLESFETNEVKRWIITGHGDGSIRIWNYQAQKLVDFVKVTTATVMSIKFIVRKQWFLAGSATGFICVYNYETKMCIIRFRASDFVTSLAVHPTKPYVLSSMYQGRIKLWNWEECSEGRWECPQTFEGHISYVHQITFNPLDTNTFASASNDKTVKVWNLASPFPDYTFSGHSGKVYCVDYFTRGDQQFLISGSQDRTAKIWDLQEKICFQTLEAFSPVTSVASHPKLPILITGSSDGSAALWSSTDFRLERIVNIGSSFGSVIGFGCLVNSRRVLIGQKNALSVLTMNNMESEEASVACNEPQITADVSPGDTTSSEKPAAPSELLDIEPLQLYFPSGLGKLLPCSLKLTNNTDDLVAFKLTTRKSRKNNYRGFLNLPICGAVQPRSTYTLVITTNLKEPPQKSYLDVILLSSALEYQNSYPFRECSEYDRFFSDAKEAGKAVDKVTIRAVYGDHQGKATSKGSTLPVLAASLRFGAYFTYVLGLRIIPVKYFIIPQFF